MKKLLAMLLTLCMLLSLAACGGETKQEEQGVAITNSLGWDLEEVYMVTAGAKTWGDPVIQNLPNGKYETLYLEVAYGSRTAKVDILGIDKDGDSYAVYNVTLNDGDICTLYLDNSADFVVDVGEARFTGEWIHADAPETEEPAPVYDIAGVWEYDNYAIYLLFDKEGNYTIVSMNGPEIADQGTYTMDGSAICLQSNSGSTEYLTMEEGGMLDDSKESIQYKDTLESSLYYNIMDSLEEEPPYFEQMGYTINYAKGDGNTYLLNGACMFTKDGSHYARVPVSVSIVQDSYNDTQDGYVEIEVTQTIQIDVEDYPDFYFEYETLTSTQRMFWDYYTGYKLNPGGGRIYGDSDRGENYHYFEYESQGRNIIIDMNFSSEWYQKNDSSFIHTQQHFFRIPIDYDGLVLAVMPMYTDYATYHSRTSDSSEPDNVEFSDEPRLTEALLYRVHTIE